MITKLDQDQQNNADALEAIGVEYPIEKRYIITQSQLDSMLEGTDEGYITLDPAPGCEHWHRTCKVCGVWPVLEGWLSDDTYYCVPCGEACTTEWYTDDAGVEHTGLTMGECYDLIEIDRPDNDFFFYTQWPLEDDDCSAWSDEPCTCHCWLCTKSQVAKGS